ncbi:GRAM domain-containing protein 2B-like isoform X2 [Eucyclogobius newberryi]|uniref:GRAM domain-containing protein 2B-like isoform X2 n=1 Tax=Eucyclogobius newberryi TaxID=166745 RepID=UPI003B59467C
MVLMAEQPDSPMSPLFCPEQLPKDSRGNWRPTCEVDNGGERRQRRRRQSDLKTLCDTGPDSRKKTPGNSLKPVEPRLPLLSAVDYETKFERKKKQPSQLSKTDAQYHKLFKEVSKDELLKQSYTCALQREILYQGKMFVSENWICFHSKVFGRDTKIVIPVISVTFFKKTKTALLVPNALVIETANEQHVFVSFLSRNTTFKLLKSICNHLEVDNVCSSPVISSCKNSFRVRCPSPLPLDFSGHLSDLDGVVQQRCQEMMESSSSGSQTPDPEDSFLSAVNSGDVSVCADVHLQSPSQKHGATRSLETARPSSHSSRLSQHVPLNAILFVYLFLVSVLVLSSCYMAFKIVALEHRLNSLLSMGGNIPKTVSHKPQDDVSAEIYGELSTNLFKLEKIQRNLQKLLDET